MRALVKALDRAALDITDAKAVTRTITQFALEVMNGSYREWVERQYAG